MLSHIRALEIPQAAARMPRCWSFIAGVKRGKKTTAEKISILLHPRLLRNIIPPVVVVVSWFCALPFFALLSACQFPPVRPFVGGFGLPLVDLVPIPVARLVVARRNDVVGDPLCHRAQALNRLHDYDRRRLNGGRGRRRSGASRSSSRSSWAPSFSPGARSTSCQCSLFSLSGRECAPCRLTPSTAVLSVGLR